MPAGQTESTAAELDSMLLLKQSNETKTTTKTLTKRKQYSLERRSFTLKQKSIRESQDFYPVVMTKHENLATLFVGVDPIHIKTLAQNKKNKKNTSCNNLQ